MGYIENWDIYIYYRNLGLHNHWLELHPLIPISNRNEKPRDTSAKVGLFSLAKFEVVGTTCEQLLSCWELVSGYLAGGWPTLWKIWKSVGIPIPIVYGNIKMFQTTNQIWLMFYDVLQHSPAFTAPKFITWNPYMAISNRKIIFPGFFHGRSMVRSAV